MGAELSVDANASAPREAWAGRDSSMRGALPEWGTGGGGAESDSDSEVEYDKSSVAEPDPARRTAWDDQRGTEAAFDTVSRQLVQPLVMSSEPDWADQLASGQPCSGRLELQFVYGYRGADCRRNLFFLPSGEVAFPAASLVVVYEARTHRQRFYTAHDAAVRCVALHPRGMLIASGQASDASRAADENAGTGAGGGAAPHICVWQPDGLETVAVLSSAHPDGVCELAFSADGERLASVGADAEHTLVLWDWRAGTRLTSSTVGASPVFALAFSPVDGSIVTAGARSLTLWRHDAAGALSGRRAQLAPTKPGVAVGGEGRRRAEPRGDESRRSEAGAREATVCCVAFLPSGLLLGGTSRGEIWCWSGVTLTARFHAHAGPVFCLEVNRTEGWVLSGGKDAKLRLWHPSSFPAPRDARGGSSNNLRPAAGAAGEVASTATPLRMLDLRSLAAQLTDAAGRPRLLGSPSIRALHWVGARVLLGTRAGELLQLDYTQSTDFPDVVLLLQGHCPLRQPPGGGADALVDTPPVAVLASHPLEPMLASAGADLSLRLWDLAQRQMVAMRQLPAAAAALAFSSGGEVLAASLHGGGVLLLDVGSLHELPVQLMAGLPPGAWQTSRALAFSPDGAVLAVGTDAGSIELFVAGGGWERLGSCQAHGAPVVSLDWSENGGELQSNSLDHELLFWDARTCTKLPAASTHALRWASANCRVSWAAKGAIGRHAHPDDLLATSRCHGGGTLACADVFGTLRLLRYPSLSPAAAERRYAAFHSGGVSGLCWSAEDGLLLSCSAQDGAILQWRHVGYEPSDEPPRPEAAAAAEQEEAELDSDVEGELRAVAASAQRSAAVAGGAANAAAGVGGASTVALAPQVLPYVSEVHAPSDWREPLDGAQAPPDSLTLEWAYGVRCHDCRAHVHWTASGEVVFPAAAVGVVFDAANRKQRFFTGHTADVLCVSMHPNRLYAASGQAGATPHACVWDTRTCQALATLRGAHSLGVSAVAFGAAGGQLATAGLEPLHAVALWDWPRGALLARVTTGAARIFGLAVRPSAQAAQLRATAAEPRSVEIAACGVRSLCFVQGNAVSAATAATSAGMGTGQAIGAADARSEVMLMRCHRGAWRGAASPCALLCVAYSASGAECYTGSVRGELLLWHDRSLLRVVSAHAGPVMALCLPPADGGGEGGDFIYSVGKGGKVRRWGEMLTPSGTIDLRQPVASLCDEWGRPLAFRGTSLCFRAASLDGAGRMLLCSASGEVFALQPSSGELQLLLQGHAASRGAGSPGSLDAVATHPSKALAATAAADMTLRLWSLGGHEMLCMRPLPFAATAAVFSPDGTLLCVGLSSGAFLVLSTDGLRPVGGGAAGAAAAGAASVPGADAEAPRGAVLGARFSPDGALLALASADSAVHVYAAASAGGWAAGWRRVAVCVGHTGAVRQLDWSEEAMALAAVDDGGGLPRGTFGSVYGDGYEGGAETVEECWLLRSCSDAAELRHWELVCQRETSRSGAQLGAVSSAKARRVRQAAAVRDVLWASDTVGFAWATMSLAPTADANSPGDHPAPLAPPAVHRSHDGEVLAGAHARGGVALWRWPANRPGSACKRYLGHASPPSALAFTHDDALLLTAGGGDLTLLQWRHHPEDGAAADPAAAALYAEELDSDVEQDLAPAPLVLSGGGGAVHYPARRRRARGTVAMPAARRAFLEASSLAQAARTPGAAMAGLTPQQPSPLDASIAGGAPTALMALDELAAPQSFAAMRPWLRQLQPPSDTARAAALTDAAPREAPLLRWVHGVRAHDLRQHLLLTAHGHAIYPAAALAVVTPLSAAASGAPSGQSPPSPPQRYYREHTAPLLSLAIHPDGVTVASGQQGSEPPIHVWDAGTLRTLAILRGAHSAGVSCLAFGGGDGSLLASVDVAPSPLLALWDWRRGQLVASAYVGRQRVLSLAFNPASGALVSCARRQLRFWSCEQGRLRSRRALFGEGAAHTVLCVAFSPSGRTMLCGTAAGCLLHWAGGRCVQALQANRQRPLFALHVGPEGVLAAGKGGRLLWWPPHCDPDAAPLRLTDARCLDLTAMLATATDANGRALAFLRGAAPCVRALAARDGALAFVTRGGELWELPVQLAAAPQQLAAAAPPYEPETALAMQQPQVMQHEVLIGAARLVVQGHSALPGAAAAGAAGGGGEACALCTHPDDPDAFATGGDDGSVRLWSVAQRRMLAMRVLPRGVAGLAYSSDGLHLAAGCADGCIAVLRAESLAEERSFRLAPPVEPHVAAAQSRQQPTALSLPQGGGAEAVAAAAAASAADGMVGVLAYSPDDSLLAAAGPGGTLQILEVGEGYRLLHCCVGHAAPVLHLDWSEDGRYVQSVCARCELLFWDVTTGARVRDPGAMRDVAWASWTCPLGWPVQGVYPKMSDGSDITSAHRSPDGRLVVTTDEFRKVNLFRYPCGPMNAACRSAAAHAAHVGLARFTCDAKHVVSVGAADLTVMVWALS